MIAKTSRSLESNLVSVNFISSTLFLWSMIQTYATWGEYIQTVHNYLKENTGPSLELIGIIVYILSIVIWILINFVVVI